MVVRSHVDSELPFSTLHKCFRVDLKITALISNIFSVLISAYQYKCSFVSHWFLTCVTRTSLGPRDYIRLHIISSYFSSCRISPGYVMFLTWQIFCLSECNEFSFAVKYNDFVRRTKQSEFHHSEIWHID
jgi:hypothetical protein